MVRVAFRVDASVQIGAGHMMRCLTLANKLRLHGAESTFIMRRTLPHLEESIQTRGHAVRRLPTSDTPSAHEVLSDYSSWLGCDWREDAEQTSIALTERCFDWLVVDHYGIDWHWEAAMKGRAGRIMAIDDLANRKHDVDLLLDQNLGRNSSHYWKLVPERAMVLTGANYALVRPEFLSLRSYSLQRRDRVRPRLALVSLGGADAGNVTSRVLQVLASVKLPLDFRVVVVVGGASPGLVEVMDQALRMPFPCAVHVDVDDMARQMADADLAIGAAGGSSWERCVLGLPSIVIVLADNQREIASALGDAGAAIPLADGDYDALRHVLGDLLVDNEALFRMSAAASVQCDGLGADRVAIEMLDGHSL